MNYKTNEIRIGKKKQQVECLSFLFQYDKVTTEDYT